MKIETKYDIGKKVWRIKHVFYRVKCPTCGLSNDDSCWKWEVFRKGSVKIRDIHTWRGSCTLDYYMVGKYEFNHDSFEEDELFLTR